MEKTEYLGLNKWALTDPIKMDDFNEDNKKIDAAIAALAGKGLHLISLSQSNGNTISGTSCGISGDWGE